MEIVRPFAPRPEISHVIFDMDGTLSWLRHGWPDMMFDLFFPLLPKREGETRETIHRFLLSEILSLNGKPTMYQMLRFAEHVRERGGTAPDPDDLLNRFQQRLDDAIAERSHRIEKGLNRPDAYVVHGARAFLELLQRRGLTLIILSGTIEHRVKHEAGLLGYDHFFGKHIYGGKADHTKFSKADVIARILEEEKIQGSHLLSFGDGPVEIACTKQVGGLAIAVATDENVNGSGIAEPFKRTELIKGGADAVIPDYRNPEVIVKTIFGS
jgi:phosphoglycolate phosphatase-like HAD superfamily hydrolase